MGSHCSDTILSASRSVTIRTLPQVSPYRWPKCRRSPVTRRSVPAAAAAARIGASFFGRPCRIAQAKRAGPPSATRITCFKRASRTAVAEGCFIIRFRFASAIAYSDVTSEQNFLSAKKNSPRARPSVECAAEKRTFASRKRRTHDPLSFFSRRSRSFGVMRSSSMNSATRASL